MILYQACPFSLHTEIERSIGFYDVSWRYIVDRKQKVYVPVARSSGETIWRKICISFINDLYGSSNEKRLCEHIIGDQSELESDNVSHSEVWLAREPFSDYQVFKGEVVLDYIVKGNCSRYGRRLLLLSSCKEKGILF